MQIYNISTVKKILICLFLFVFISGFGCGTQRARVAATNTLSPVLIGPIETFGKKINGKTNKTSINDFYIYVGHSSGAASMGGRSVSSTTKEGSNKVDVELLKAGLTTKSFAVIEKIGFNSSATNCAIVVLMMTSTNIKGEIYLLKSALLIK